MDFAFDMQIIELDSFDTAFPVQPGKESAVKRRFMTLFASGERAQVGGTSYVRKVQSFTGETFALKQLLAGNAVPKDANLTPEDTARITQGHAAAFYEEYKNQLLVSRMRGFPKLYGYGTIGDDPAIVMEWVEGVSVRDYARGIAAEGQAVAPLAIAAIGVSVLQVLEGVTRLDSTLVHRDISPANIMIRTTAATVDTQAQRGSYDVCLIDFGSAVAQDPQDASFTMVSQVWRNGTPEYAAPEMLTQDIPHVDELRKSQAIDVFALCSVLYELYAGHTPWRVGEHPEVSPFRLKMENPPEPLLARRPEDEPLVRAIMSGLATDQQQRPTVIELLGSLRAYAMGLGSALGQDAEAEDVRGAHPEAGLLGSVLPTGLYTPDSTRLTVASVEEGGKRAGEDVPAFDRQQARAVSRRSFIAGGLAVAVAALVGGGVAARSCKGAPAFDFSAYPVADAVSDAGALVLARRLIGNDWVLRDAASRHEYALGASGASTRDPGKLVDGLVRVYDAASGGYGFMTVTGEGQPGDRSAAWYILPRYADAGDFARQLGEDPLEDGRFAAVKDRETGLWGYIDASGNERIAPAFAQAARFGNAFAAVRGEGGGAWGLIDAGGRLVLQPQFVALGLCSDEGLMAAAKTDTAHWGFVDAGGNWVIPDAYRRVRRFTAGLAGCMPDAESGLWGFIDADGKTVVEPRFSNVLPFSEGARPLAPAQDAKTALWGLVDTSGSWAVEPLYLNMGEAVRAVGVNADDTLFPAHGSPANVYDIYGKDAAAWEEFAATHSDWMFGYGFANPDGTWAIAPTYGDTHIRQPEC